MQGELLICNWNEELEYSEIIYNVFYEIMFPK